MIESSFVILERVGHVLEQRLWQQGLHSWNHFQKAEHVDGLSQQRKLYYDRRLDSARTALNNYDSEFFTGLLPKADVWRLYDKFKEDAVFLDIETSGYYTDITVVGLYDGLRTMTMVKGINMDMAALKQHLKRYKLIVTFNGLSFDAVVLERYYPGLLPRVPHFDVRFACQRIGLVGGLKSIEKQLGIKRLPEVDGLSGADAPALWEAYKSTGNIKHLHKLVAYNEEDTVNLKILANHTFKELKKKLVESYGLPT